MARKEKTVFVALKDPHGNTAEVFDLPLAQAMDRITAFIENMQSEGLAGSVLFMQGKGGATRP